MLIITLGQPSKVDPATDPLGRSRGGYHEDMSDRELFDVARYAWVIGARGDAQRYALVCSPGQDRIVRQAIEIFELVDAPEVSQAGRPRRAIEGKILRSGHPVYDTYVGKSSPAPPQRNPVSYVATEFDPCRCGCGEPALDWFVAGHDQKALHERIARIGNVAEFIEWFDRASPRPTRNTPNMQGAAKTITDPHLLFERIGYRILRNYLAGNEPNEFRQGFIDAELKQLSKVLGHEPKVA